MGGKVIDPISDRLFLLFQPPLQSWALVPRRKPAAAEY
jgi:hypothetical protein